ncbi:MAG: hypothetical protein AAF821_12160 [Cyanobacteria bacterium P01_D01_bin.156]
MTWFSLKRTLQSELAAKIDDLYRINQGNNALNLHTPVRYSEVLLSIGKITKICHQNIPVKKVSCNETVTYFSAFPLSVANTWQRPADLIASVLLSLLKESDASSVWSHVRKTDRGCLEFVISQQGIRQWLNHDGLTHLWVQDVPSIDSQLLWQLQAGYELCHRWSANQPLEDLACYCPAAPDQPFIIPWSYLEGLVDGLLDICDIWDEATSTQLLHQASKLVMALDQCVGQTSHASLGTVKSIIPWVKTTRLLLKRLLIDTWGYQLAEQF